MQIPNYLVKEVIGQGAMATVYRAEHVLLKHERALKVMSPSLSREAGFQENFIREGQIIASLQHPHIITIYDIGCSDDGYFMAMKYLSGGSLEDRLKQGSLSLNETFNVFRQIGEALHYAHEKNLIHRDIKPANILFNEKGEAILTDFGISKLQNTEGDLTRFGYEVIGTPRYMSPEQASGEKLDRRSDLYSFALVFYEILSGEAAIKANTMVAMIREHTLAPVPLLPAKYSFLQSVLDKALAKTPDERYATVREFLNAVNNKISHDDKKTVIMLRPAQS